MEDITTYLIELAKKYAPGIAFALITLLVGFWIIRLIMRVVRKKVATRVEPELQGFLEGLISVTLNIMLMISVITILGVKTTSFIAILGAASLAIGLALQGSLSNLASGILIIVQKPYKIGDFIEVEGNMGYVREINFFKTVLDTLENKQVLIPNEIITRKQLLNHFSQPARRIEVIMKVHISEDTNHVRETIYKIIEEEDYILKSKMGATIVGLKVITDYSMEFSSRVWCDSSKYWDAYYGIHEAFKKGFDAAGIKPPVFANNIYMDRDAISQLSK